MEAPTHLVLIPSYNTGPRLATTVAEALRWWPHMWVVLDGSTDGSADALDDIARANPGFRLLRRPHNGGKGAAVQTGLIAARAAGFTHALVMDADGQHPADHIPAFLAASVARPEAMVLGQPVFGPEVPLERLHGRKISVGLVRLETLGCEVGDPLFGFRVYPIAPLQELLERISSARGYDFDPAVAVRLYCAGVPAVQLPAPCRYLSRAEGGVSHFNYIRDNAKMVRLHVRLLAELICWRWRAVRRIRRQRRLEAIALHEVAPIV
jgi:glycosyltransferase involved in cell wall biosynthesis